MPVDTLCLVNHTHTDFGYTDHPESLFRQQRRIIDKAIAKRVGVRRPGFAGPARSPRRRCAGCGPPSPPR